jgi:hypothetical protein
MATFVGADRLGIFEGVSALQTESLRHGMAEGSGCEGNSKKR